MLTPEVAIIGGGPAGMAAGLGAWEAGARSILIIERESGLGGILNQCIHNGFGLHRFKEELTGPEYAARFSVPVRERAITVWTETMVTDLAGDRTLTAVNASGLHRVRPGALVLAMGCRERARGALNIPGNRPAGVMTAGTAQRFVNLDGYLPGTRVVILGSGDIGLIMARRMRLEGARVEAVVEVMPYPGGLKRNIVQCLDDFAIPLLLSHTVTRITGAGRLTGVTIARVDEQRQPVPGTERVVSCDTLLLSVGLLPENELTRAAGIAVDPVTGGAAVGESLQTSCPGVFSCGNVLHVHDLVDFVSAESELAGRNAALYAGGASFPVEGIAVRPGAGVRYVLPGTVNPDALDAELPLRLRVSGVFRGARLTARLSGRTVYSRAERILTPGEMRTLILKKDVFASAPAGATLTVAVETEEEHAAAEAGEKS